MEMPEPARVVLADLDRAPLLASRQGEPERHPGIGILGAAARAQHPGVQPPGERVHPRVIGDPRKDRRPSVPGAHHQIGPPPWGLSRPLQQRPQLDGGANLSRGGLGRLLPGRPLFVVGHDLLQRGLHVPDDRAFEQVVLRRDVRRRIVLLAGHLGAHLGRQSRSRRVAPSESGSVSTRLRSVSINVDGGPIHAHTPAASEIFRSSPERKAPSHHPTLSVPRATSPQSASHAAASLPRASACSYRAAYSSADTCDSPPTEAADRRKRGRPAGGATPAAH